MNELEVLGAPCRERPIRGECHDLPLRVASGHVLLVPRRRVPREIGPRELGAEEKLAFRVSGG